MAREITVVNIIELTVIAVVLAVATYFTHDYIVGVGDFDKLKGIQEMFYPVLKFAEYGIAFLSLYAIYGLSRAIYYYRTQTPN